MNNAGAQRRLFTEADLTLEKALAIAQGMETAEANSKSLKGLEGTATVDKVLVGKFSQMQVRQLCHRCGKKNHQPQQCKFKDSTCHFCGKRGHIAPVCRKKQTRKSAANRDQNHSYRPLGSSQRGLRGPRPRSNHRVQADNEEGELFTVRSGIEGLLTVEVNINGKPTEMEIDTGASVSIMSEGTQSENFQNCS